MRREGPLFLITVQQVQDNFIVPLATAQCCASAQSSYILLYPCYHLIEFNYSIKVKPINNITYKHVRNTRFYLIMAFSNISVRVYAHLSGYFSVEDLGPFVKTKQRVH